MSSHAWSLRGHLKQLRARWGAKWCVAALLLPVAIFGVAHFGPRAALVIGVTLGTCVLGGVLPRLVAGDRWKLFHDGTIVTSLLLALSMSVDTPIYMVVSGALVASIAGKWRFGRLGRNPLNPAALGRAVVAILEWIDPPWQAVGRTVDLSTGASPLPVAQGGAVMPEWLDLLLGFTKGAIGETSAALLLIVGGGLLWRVALKREAAIAMIVVTPLLVLAMPFTPEAVGHAPWAHNPLYYLFGSGTLFIALFFATDPVTTPSTRAGGIAFGLGAAAIAVTCKLMFAIPGAEMWGILAMNAATPLLDRAFGIAPADRAKGYAVPEGFTRLPNPVLHEPPAAVAVSAALSLRMNGVPLRVRAGTTILEAAHGIGAFVPTLCYLGHGRAPGACRICLVHCEGRSRLLNACDTPVEDGMVVRTDVPEVLEAQRGVMLKILREHGRCGDTACQVEQLASRLGVDTSAIPETSPLGAHVLTEYLAEDQAYCISCNRCIAACGERDAIFLAQRGRDRRMHIHQSACTNCGDCMAACPSGAIQRR